jgi:hypothetical protein
MACLECLSNGACRGVVGKVSGRRSFLGLLGLSNKPVTQDADRIMLDGLADRRSFDLTPISLLRMFFPYESKEEGDLADGANCHWMF